MKPKKLLAIILSLMISLGAIPVFAYSDSVLTGKFVTEGENPITNADPHTVSIYYFTAESEAELGTYKVTTDTPSAKLRSYCGTIGFRYDDTDNTDYDPETNSYTFTATSVGAKYLIGVTGAESFTLKLEKVSDYKIPTQLKSKFTKVQHYDYRKCDLIVSEEAERIYVDVTEPHTVVWDRWNYAHLDSIDGPVLYVDIYNTPYIDLYGMAMNGALRYVRFSDSGSYISKTDYSGMYLDYEFYADPRLGVYPIDPHMTFILKDVGKANGWYDKDRELGYYLFGDMEVDEESAYLFPCFYFADPASVKKATGHKETPRSLVCDNYNGNFCVLDGTGSSDFSDYFTLDVYENSEVTCMAIAPDLSTYKAFSIRYNSKDYKPDSDGILTLKTDGSSDMIEVANTGKTNGVTFVLILTSTEPEYEPDGSPEAPYIAPLGAESSIYHAALAPGEFICVMAETAHNATVRLYALNTGGARRTEYCVFYGEDIIMPDSKSGLVIFELDERDNIYLIYNFYDEPIQIYASLLKTDPAAPELCGSEELPYMLFCDDYDFSTYSVPAGESLHFQASYPDGTYVIAMATDENYETSVDFQLCYGGKPQFCPSSEGAMIAPMCSEGEFFEIQNYSDSDIMLNIILVSDISFLTPEGSFENPQVIDLGEHTATVTEEYSGHVFYTYTAIGSGRLFFEIDSTSADGWIYSITNTDSGYSTTNVFSEEGAESSCSVTVSEGDTVIICVGTYDGKRFWLTPEGQVSWHFEFFLPTAGDVNLDGEINAKDSNLLKRYVSGEMTLDDPELFVIADLNHDGEINAKDSNILKRYLSGEISGL